MIENLPPSKKRAPQDLRYAFFYERLIAHILDAILIALIMGPLYSLFFTEGLDALTLNKEQFTSTDAWFFARNILPLILTGTYNALFIITSWRTTPGKRIMGIRIVTEKGAVPNPVEIFLRCSIGYFVSSILFFIGYIMILFTEKSQGLHDIVFKTVVVKHKL